MRTVFPYTAMRSFEAVARLNGFMRAADELGVTQSSVSQQVRALEEWTGRRLLVRGQRKTVPTADGEMLADAIRTGFGQVETACAKLRRPDPETAQIVVFCPPGFAVNWLFPRLIKFDTEHPNIPVSISTERKDNGYFVEGSELAIGYGLGEYPGLHVEKLMSERLFPVCAPKLIEGPARLESAADLVHYTVLVDEISHQGGRPPTWENWAEDMGVMMPLDGRRRVFGQSNMAIQAAEMGMGVALGRETLVADAMAQGRLVAPIAGRVASHYSYWLVLPERSLKYKRIKVFVEWLRREFAAQAEQSDHFGV